MLESFVKGFTTVVDRNALGWNTRLTVVIFCHGKIAPDQLRAACEYPRGGQRGNGDWHVRRDPARARFATCGIWRPPLESIR